MSVCENEDCSDFSNDLEDNFRKEIQDQAVIYQKNPLTEFQIQVNSAAAEVALLQPSLFQKGNRGLLLEKARKMVADQGYCFKKGASRSKMYGNAGASTLKRSKINQNTREK